MFLFYIFFVVGALFLHYAAAFEPTVEPSVVPSFQPTYAPENMELFALLGDSYCAQGLQVGPVPVTLEGSGVSKYGLSTLVGKTLHRNWLQVVTDGEIELFRIHWAFQTQKNLADRFASAVKVGEDVSYRVVDSATGRDYNYTGAWRFTSNPQAADMATLFASQYVGWGLGPNGAWGASNGAIDGNHVFGSRLADNTFWGIGNFFGSPSDCANVYQNGVITSTTAKVFMYYDITLLPTAQPSWKPPSPSVDPNYVVMKVELQVNGMSYTDYEAFPMLFDKVFASSVASTLVYVTVEEVVYVLVTPVTRRRLSTVALNPIENFRHAEEDVVDTNYLRSHAVYRGTLDSAVTVHLTIEVARSRGFSYKELSSSLRDSVSRGYYTYTLQAFASRSHLPGYFSVSTVGFKTEDASYNSETESSDEKGSVLTVPAIVGIVIGGICVIFLVVCWATRGAVLFAMYRCVCPCRSSVEPQDPFRASAPPLENSKDIDSYFYADLRSQSAPSGGNIVVTDGAAEKALGLDPLSLGGASVFHPPVLSGAGHSYQGLFGGGTVSRSPELLSGDISKPVDLPIATLAVPLNHEAAQGNTDIAVAEAYVGDV